MSQHYLYLAGLFDTATSRRIERIRERLYQAGVSQKPALDIPPHITLGRFDLADLAAVTAHLSQLVSAQPAIPVQFIGLGQFGEAVLYIVPAESPHLSGLRRRVTSGLKCHEEHDWVPHTTLLYRQPEHIAAARRLIEADFEPFAGWLERLGLYDFPPGRLVAEYDLL